MGAPTSRRVAPNSSRPSTDPVLTPGSVSLRARVVCEVRYAKFGGGDKYVGDVEREMGVSLSKVLEGCVLVERYAKNRFDVDVFVVEDDGGVVSAAVTAASAALADAGIEVRDLMGGCVVGVGEEGRLVVDPCAREEREVKGKVWVACMPMMGLIVDVGQEGEIELETLMEAIKVGMECAEQVVGLVRNCLLKRAKKLKKRVKS